jgi:predicted acetyltransferase
MQSNAILVRPNAMYQKSFLEAVREFQEAGSALEDTQKITLQTIENDFEAYIQSRLKYENPAALEHGYVPQWDLWLIENQEFIGRSKLRHKLNDRLREFGGHIGYEIRPSKRRMGYGSLLLKLTFEKARELGLKRVLITCDVENLGSRGVIEANDGKLEGEFMLPFYDKPIRRYWIELSPA